MSLNSTDPKKGKLSLSLLGPFEASADGQSLRFATDATRALLAYIAIESGQQHPRSSIATLLWPDYKQAAALANLRQTVARLRKGLAETGAADLLQVTRQTLAIDPDGVDLDCVQFESIIAACTSRAQGMPASDSVSVQRLEQACALYRGEFLDGLFTGSSQLFDEWVALLREQHHRQALVALDMLTNLYEANADYAAMRRTAIRQIELEPWREEAHRQLMRALALQGERNAALDQYETCRLVLATELGIEPDTETRALYEHIRDDTLAPMLQRAATPEHNLPAQRTPFIGRERELDAIRAVLDDPGMRVLTIVGAGGMGKTRLALEAASKRLNGYPDGVHFVQLAPVGRPDAIAPTIASTMGLELSGNISTALASALRDKQMLLVLDNFEHVLEGAPALVPLLEAASDVQVIVTSRERLRLLGEYTFVVHGMDYGEAEFEEAPQLFVQAVRRIRPGFTPNGEDLAHVRHICELLEGMPLGLELAAAWADLLPLEEIAREIEQSIDFLASELPDVPERHRSVRAVFAGSWRVLDESDQRAFRLLSVFQGGFTREAALQVAGASLRTLARLGRKSLLAPQEGRYQIHELLRKFGAEQLDLAAGERSDVEQKHSDYYLTLVADRQAVLDGVEPHKAAAQLKVEIDNIEKAWTFAAQHHRVSALDNSALGLWRFSSLIGSTIDLAQIMQLAAESLETCLQHGNPDKSIDVSSDERTVSKLRALQAAALVSEGDFDAAIAAGERAIELGRNSRGIEGEIFGYLSKGQGLVQKAEYVEAQRSLEHALQSARRELPGEAAFGLLDFVEYLVYLWLGSIANRQSQTDRARQLFRRSLDICRRRRDARGEIHGLANLANVARADHDYTSARRYYEEAMELARRLGYRWGEATSDQELGDVVRLQGDPEFARELTERSLRMYQEIGDRVREAVSLAYLGRLLVYLGDAEGARAYLDRFLHMIEGIDVPFAEDWGCAALAIRLHDANDPEQALIYARRAAAAAERVGSNVDHADALNITAQILIDMDKQVDAVIAYQMAIDLLDGAEGASETITARAGLAILAIDRQDEDDARTHVDSILASMAKHPDGCVERPFAIQLACFRVLDALGDSRAPSLIERAHRGLLGYAQRISDSTRQRLFLKDVKAHRELQDAYAERFELIPSRNRQTQV